MAHRGPMRELFGMLCMAVLVRESEKKAAPPTSTFYVDTFAAVDDYFTTPNVTGNPPSSAPSTGYLPFIVPFFVLALSVVANQMLDSIFYSAVQMVLLPLIRIARRWSVAIITSSWRRVCGWRSRGRVAGQDAASNISQSTQSQAASATSKDLDSEKKIEESSLSPPPQAATATSDGLANEDEVDKFFAALRAMGRKDKRVANHSKPKKRQSKKTTNLNGSKTRLVERVRKTLDPESVHSPNSNVLFLAKDMKRNLKRVNNKVLTLEMEQQSSVAEVRRTEQAAARQREQSAVTEALNAERTAVGEREQRLIKQRDAAPARASNAISQESYDSLRKSFDKLRDQFKEAEEGRKAAVDELRAEQAKTETLAQQGSESTATGTTVPSDDRITSLEQEALAKDKAVQDAETKAEEAKKEAEEAKTRAEEAKKGTEEAKTRAEESEVRARDADSKVQEAEAKVQEAKDTIKEADLRVHELNEKLQRAEEALEKAGNGTEETSGQEPYQQGYQAAVLACEANAQTIIAREVDAAVTRRDAEVFGQLRTEAENAVAREKASLQAEINAANLRATTAESKAAADANTALTEALQRATTAEARANTAEADLKESQSSLDTVKQNASGEWQRAEDNYKTAEKEWNRAQTAEGEVKDLKEEVRKFKEGKTSQDLRIQGYKDDISRLKRLIPADASLMFAELESAQRDRQRAQALLEESSVRSYDWDTKQVLKRLLEANEKIIELECTLKDARTQPSQTELLKMLLNAELDPQQYTSLNLPMRQVLVKQCRAVNARFEDLRTIIKSSERPRKEGLLFALYQARGDEEAYYDQDDPKPEPSSDEDEDGNATNSGVQRSAPRRLNQPTSSRARRATVPQVAQAPLPVDARVHNDLKRKGSPIDAPDAASRKETRQNDDPSIGYPVQASPSRNGEAFDQANLDPQLPAIGSTPVQHPASPNPFASTATPSHPEQAPQPKPSRKSGPRQKPHLTVSERQQRLRFVPNPESEATSEQEAAAPTSIPGPKPFSFNMPKNIASGIRPHVRKYTSLSELTNIVRVAADNPPPATPNRDPIFRGLALLGPAVVGKQKWMPDKKAALPGLPPPDEGDVLEFESSAVAEDPAPRREVEDRHQTHSASDDEEDGKIVRHPLPLKSTLTSNFQKPKQYGKTRSTHQTETTTTISTSSSTLSLKLCTIHPIGSTMMIPPSEPST